MSWEKEFRRRIDAFKSNSSKKNNGYPLSVKIRVASGCFHREHSPNAYKNIDSYIRGNNVLGENLLFEEHESGPELLVYLELGAAGIHLLSSVIDLIVVIFSARANGIRKGDGPDSPLELILRRYDKNEKLKEEKILKYKSTEPIDRKIIENALNESISSMISNENK